ncbi:MAG: motility-associated protein [Vicinamibacterales bacterium]
MLLIVGIVVVLGSVVGGYLMAGGHLILLVQPSEFVIIGGAAIGSMLISTPPKVLQKMVAQLLQSFSSGLTAADYGDLLAMLYQVFRQAQSGIMTLEPHFENPDSSSILSKYPKFLARHHSVAFLADSIKVIIVGGMQPHDLEALMDEDLTVHHEDEKMPSGALAKVADALPGLASWRPCWASSSRCRRSTARPRRSATTSARRWWAPSSAS